jgi:hypothetical protein
MTPAQILAHEQERATQNPPETRPFWHLVGSDEDHLVSLMECLFNCSAADLRKIPQLRLHGSQAIDAGGVFRDKVNRLFQQLLDSRDILEEDQITGCLLFCEYEDSLQYASRQKQYSVLGTIVYWFVFIHPVVPYPLGLHPAIIAYAINGYVPNSVLARALPAVAPIIRNIESYTILTSLDEIHDDVKSWLEAINYRIELFLADLHDRNRGAQYLAREIGTRVIMGKRKEAFDMFRNGYRKMSGVFSVCLSIRVPPVQLYSNIWVLYSWGVQLSG